MTLVEFLRARLADDEAKARWAMEVDPYVQADEKIKPLLFDEAGDFTLPARVLAQVDSTRELIEQYEAADKTYQAAPPNADLNNNLWITRQVWGETLRVLARAYHYHPEFQEEWRRVGFH